MNYQGKRKDQIESSQKIFVVVFLLGLSWATFYLIFFLIKTIIDLFK